MPAPPWSWRTEYQRCAGEPVSVLDEVPPKADRRIHYGTDESQFADLWLPRGPVPASGWPVVAFLHGGWWSSGFDLLYGGFLCRALRDSGVAVWSIEYRRTGITGGGWPATFQDAAAGFDHLALLREPAQLDLGRVVAVGHSAGGHLALWLAGRAHIPESSVLHAPQPRVALRGVVGLAAAADLGLLLELSVGTFAGDRLWVEHLMGGSPAALPLRYAAADPGRLLPLVCAQALVQGSDDGQIPPGLPERWAVKVRRNNGSCSVTRVPEADHFDVVDPRSRAWPVVRAAIFSMLSAQG